MRAKIACLKHEHGAAVVEAIIAFTGFLFVIFTILNVVNFCRAQATISNAVDSAAKEMAQYAYFYEMSGLQKFSDKLNSNASVGADQVNEVIGTVETFYGSIGTLKDNTLEDASRFQKTIEAGEIDTSQIETALTNLETNGNNVQAAFSSMTSSFGDILDNPLKYVKSMVAIGANQGLNMIKSYVIAAPIAKALTLKHFGKTAGEASKALENLGVVGGADGMNFNMSSIFHSSTPDEVHLAVYYKLKLVQLFDWATFEVPLCKEAVARAWLGGDDVIVKMEPTTNPPAGGGGESPGESGPEGEESSEEESGEEESGEEESAEEESVEEEPSETEEMEENLWGKPDTYSKVKEHLEELLDTDFNSLDSAFGYHRECIVVESPDKYVLGGYMFTSDLIIGMLAQDKLDAIDDIKDGKTPTTMPLVDGMPSSEGEWHFQTYLAVPENMSQADKDRILQTYQEKLAELRKELDPKLTAAGYNPAKIKYEPVLTPCGGELITEEEAGEGAGGGT